MQKLISRLNPSNVIFFSCDMQTLFNDPKLIYGIEGVLQSCLFMTEVAQVFKIPIIVTEHNPKVFGETIPAIKKLLPPHHHLFEKSTFSMYNNHAKELLKNYENRKTVIIYGIETHICIHQTCLDLVQNGYNVHLLTDGTSSSKPLFRSTTLQKLAQYGVALNTTQGVLFELLGDYKTPEFKEAIKIVKRYPLDSMISHL